MENTGNHGERWAVAEINTVELQETARGETEEELEEDEDETLSLSALPFIPKKDENEEKINGPLMEDQTHEDFDFCSLSKESEMCTADEIFFQGQILPFRHSVSSEKGLLLQPHGSTRSISRSESMDRLCSGLISSRSSSISSHQSSSSSGTSSGPNRRPKLPPARNQFHSHPSPSPRNHFPSKRRTISANHRNSSAKRSPAWSIFRLGILAPPPEMAYQDLRPRARCRNFGSRNSTESSGSSAASRNSSSRFKKNLSSLGGCKCSADAVDTLTARVVIIKRSASEGETDPVRRQNGEEIKPAMAVKNCVGKKQSSHHRTSEWLKQLSLDDARDEA